MRKHVESKGDSKPRERMRLDDDDDDDDDDDKGDGGVIDIDTLEPFESTSRARRREIIERSRTPPPPTERIERNPLAAAAAPSGFEEYNRPRQGSIERRPVMPTFGYQDEGGEQKSSPKSPEASYWASLKDTQESVIALNLTLTLTMT